jgi:hypothetical protein
MKMRWARGEAQIIVPCRLPAVCSCGSRVSGVGGVNLEGRRAPPAVKEPPWPMGALHWLDLSEPSIVPVRNKHVAACRT